MVSILVNKLFFPTSFVPNYTTGCGKLNVFEKYKINKKYCLDFESVIKQND